MISPLGAAGQHLAQGGSVLLAAAVSAAASWETAVLRAAAIPVTIFQG